MAVRVLLCGCEAWTTRKNDWSKIHVAEIKYFRAVKSCARTYRVRNEDAIKKLNIFSIDKKTTFYRNK